MKLILSKKYLSAQAGLYVALFALPIIISYASYSHFNKTSLDVKNELALRSAKVAGIKTDIPGSEDLKEVPLMDGSNILSYDSNDKNINVTIETNQTSDKIKKFYEDFFRINGWAKENDQTYKKNDMKMSVNVENNLAIISYTKD